MNKQESLLMMLGASVSTKGFDYILCAGELIHKDPSVLGSITEGLYPAVAKEFSATPSRVERCIRHAICSIYANGVPAETFAPSPGKERLTNKEFLARFAKVAYDEES